jgi:hypothetical protein
MDHKNEEAEKCVDSERKVITEGKAEVLLSSAKNVFYNPVQEFNRDLRYVHYISDGTVSYNRPNKVSLNLRTSLSIYGPDFLFILCCKANHSHCCSSCVSVCLSDKSQDVCTR